MYTTEKEPSGIRLMRLINTRILEIAKREFSNHDRLCLYGTGGWWTAFEHSAFALSRLFPGLESFIVTPPGCPFTIVGLSIPEKDLKKYLKSHPALRQSPDYLELPAAPFRQPDYDTWHTALINDFKSIEADIAGNVS